MRARTLVLASVGVASMVCAAVEAQSLSTRIQGVMQQRAAQQEVQYATRGTMLRALLRTGLTVNFDQTPAKEAFAFVKKALGTDIVFRWSTDPGATSGLDPETPITLTATNAPALAVLESMLEQATTEPSTWQLRSGYIEVGPKSRLNARNAQETRIYPIRDLLFQPPNFTNAPEFNLNDAISQGGQQGGGGGGGSGGGGFGGGGGGGGGFGGGGGGGGNIIGTPGAQPERPAAEERAQELIDLIQNTVEPDAWMDPTVASIRYYDGMLIVRAPDYVQRQIGGYGMMMAQDPQPRPRYVSITAPIGVAQNVKFTSVPVTGAAGGGGSFVPNGGAGGTGTNGSGNGGSTSAPTGQQGTSKDGKPQGSSGGKSSGTKKSSTGGTTDGTSGGQSGGKSGGTPLKGASGSSGSGS